MYRKISNIRRTKSQTYMIPVSSCSCLFPIPWSQVLSQWWRCSWSSADRRCSNYIWVISKFIVHYGASYISGLTVNTYTHEHACNCEWLCIIIINTTLLSHQKSKFYFLRPVIKNISRVAAAFVLGWMLFFGKQIKGFQKNMCAGETRTQGVVSARIISVTCLNGNGSNAVIKTLYLISGSLLKTSTNGVSKYRTKLVTLFLYRLFKNLIYRG